MKDLLTGCVCGRVATWRTQLLLNSPEGLHELFILQGITQATLRGGLGRIGDWSDPTHCTSQQEIAATEQQTNRFGSHLSALANPTLHTVFSGY